jgi:hypothetical protein
MMKATEAKTTKLLDIVSTILPSAPKERLALPVLFLSLEPQGWQLIKSPSLLAVNQNHKQNPLSVISL